MPQLPGVLVSLLETVGPLSNYPLPGRCLAEISAGLKHSLLNFSSISWNRWAYDTIDCSSTLITKVPSVRWRKGVALTPTLIFLSAVLILPFPTFQYPQILSTLSLWLTQLTPSHVENLGRLEGRSSLLLCSQKSLPIPFFMFSLNPKLTSSTSVAERSVGEKQPHRSIPPCPMHPQNSFHPFQRPAPSLPPSDCPSSYASSKSYLKPHPQPMKPQTPTPHATHAHKPHTGRSIANSNLCPHVPAADRIFSWCMPFGSHHQHDAILHARKADYKLL